MGPQNQRGMRRSATGDQDAQKEIRLREQVLMYVCGASWLHAEPKMLLMDCC